MARLFYGLRPAGRAHSELTTRGLETSFTAWIVSVMAPAISEHKHINSYRQDFFKVVEFEDVDIFIVVERTMGGIKQPLP